MKILDRENINSYFPSTELYRVFFQLPEESANFLMKEFSHIIREKVDSGHTLHACLGNIENKEAFLSLFSLTDLYHFSNELRIRNYTYFPFIKNKLFQLSACEEIKKLINENTAAYPLETLQKLLSNIEKTTCRDSLIDLANICMFSMGITMERLTAITKWDRMVETPRQEALFPDEINVENPYVGYTP